MFFHPLEKHSVFVVLFGEKGEKGLWFPTIRKEEKGVEAEGERNSHQLQEKPCEQGEGGELFFVAEGTLRGGP